MHDHLEHDRGNSVRTRNARLAAIHSLFRYAAPRAPEHAAIISQVLAIPPRRRERAIVSYLTPQETDALLAAPDRKAWHGRRDHALLLLAVQTGLRQEVLPVAKHLAEVRGLSANMVRRLERLEGDLLAERHARVDDLALLIDLIASGWKGVDERLARLEHVLGADEGAIVYRIEERKAG